MGVNVHFSNPSTVSQPLNDFLLSLVAMRIEEMSPLDCMTKLYEIKRTAGSLRETLTTPPEPPAAAPKPTNHQIAADSSAPVKLSKAQRELLEKLDRGVDIRGYHYDNPRDMTFRLQSAKPINLKTIRILESAGLIAIRRDGRDDVLVLTDAGRSALKGAK